VRLLRQTTTTTTTTAHGGATDGAAAVTVTDELVGALHLSPFAVSAAPSAGPRPLPLLAAGGGPPQCGLLLLSRLCTPVLKLRAAAARALPDSAGSALCCSVHCPRRNRPQRAASGEGLSTRAEADAYI
jgi:hypothetical protein